MKNKHTPGPWVVCPDLTTDYLFNIYDENKNIVNDRDMDSDSRLIAAAPDLLSVLEVILDEYQQVCEDNKVMGCPLAVHAAKLVIAKARGKPAPESTDENVNLIIKDLVS